MSISYVAFLLFWQGSGPSMTFWGTPSIVMNNSSVFTVRLRRFISVEKWKMDSPKLPLVLFLLKSMGWSEAFNRISGGIAARFPLFPFVVAVSGTDSAQTVIQELPNLEKLINNKKKKNCCCATFTAKENLIALLGVCAQLPLNNQNFDRQFLGKKIKQSCKIFFSSTEQQKNWKINKKLDFHLHKHRWKKCLSF